MAKKGIVSQISNYGANHPYVTLALAGTFGYYFYENMVKPRMESEEKPDMRYAVQGIGMTTSTSTTTSSSHIPSMRNGETGEPSMEIPHGSGLFGRKNPPAHIKARYRGGYHMTTNQLSLEKDAIPGVWHRGMNGLGACHKCGTRKNPHCHCGGDLGRSIRPDPVSDRFLNEQIVTKSISGYSPSARRRVGHSGIGMASDSYEPTFDTQFSNQEAMITGDLKKHEDILGFSGLMPLQGGDWHE